MLSRLRDRRLTDQMADCTQYRHSSPDARGVPATRAAAGLFGGPALRRPYAPRVAADVVGSFTFGRGGRAYEVDVVVDGVRCRTIVYNRRVTFGYLRGDLAVEILDESLAAEAQHAAIDAAQRAECGGTA